MKTKKTPAPRRAGTAKRVGAEEALARLGDDPATMILMIELMDRLIANQRSRRRKAR